MSGGGPSEPSRKTGAAGSIFRATLVLAGVTLGVRLLGLVKNQVVAALFGVGGDVEAYFLAVALPTLAFGALGTTLATALIPVYADARARAGDTRRLVGDVGALALAGFVVAAGLLAALWPLFLGWSGHAYDDDQRALATRLFFVLLPIVVLHGMAMFGGAVLKAEKRFFEAAVGMALIPVAAAMGAWLAAARFGVTSLAVGHVLGVALELGLVALFLKQRGLPLLSVPRSLSEDARRVVREYAPALGGGLLVSGTLAIDQAMAARLSVGSLATLNYAYFVVMAALSIGAMALGAAILPFLSDMVAAGRWDSARASVRRYGRLVILVTVPAALAVALLAHPLITILYQRGAFEGGDTDAVARVLALYALQAPFYTLSILFSRLLSALQGNALVLRAAVFNLGLNVLLNLLFIRWIGVGGIALSTSVVHAICCAMLYWMARSRLASASREATAEPVC